MILILIKFEFHLFNQLREFYIPAFDFVIAERK